MTQYTKNEIEIVETLRSLRAYEQMIVTADATGKPDSYLVVRSNKVMLREERELLPVR